MGRQPQWYVVMQAAKYLDVAPWDLIKQPIYWTDWALEAMRAESKADAPAEPLNPP